MSYFSVEGLSLQFGGIRAISELEFSVEQGDVFALIGPNGAGKTSVFNVITRVFDPDAGRITFKGDDLTAVPRHRIADHGIARTFQNIELFESESVLQNLLLGRHRFAHDNVFAQMVRTPSVRRFEEQSRERAEEIIEFLDLAPYRNTLVQGLPYGIRKNVELARALASEPELMLLDEPASGLNPEETRELARWIRAMVDERGITVLMVEHDMTLVSETATRVMCMNMGRRLAIGTASEIQQNPDVIAAYIGA